RRHVDHRSIGLRLGHCIDHGVEDRHPVLEALAALPRRDAGDDAGAVLEHLLRVKRAVAARDPLNDYPGRVVDEYAHAACPPVASCTAFCTALSMSVIAEKPLLSRICTAISSLVPVSRITIGPLRGFDFVAVTIPLATSSVRVMPPKMLKRIAFTFGSAVMILSALMTFSGFDEPPMSRKLAGSP